MPKYADITGWGKCMPPAVLTNDDLASIIDTSDEWIQTRSGIRERRVSHVPGSDLAAVAVHAKTAVIDGVWSTVGSTNLDWRSFLHNEEVNAVVLGTEFGDRMRAAFLRDLAQSEKIEPEQWRQRSIGVRLKERLARVWQYWL